MKGKKLVDCSKDGEKKVYSNGNIGVRVNGYMVSEHRHIWEKHKGKIPKNCFIHHINEDRQDNRIENLQLVTRKEHGLLHRKPNRIRTFYPNGNVKVTKKELSRETNYS